MREVAQCFFMQLQKNWINTLEASGDVKVVEVKAAANMKHDFSTFPPTKQQLHTPVVREGT